MKNRAKCKLCDTIIESLHANDYQLCKCGSIYVDGGDLNKCGAKNWEHFVRINDDGNEVIPQIVNEEKDEVAEVKPMDDTEKREILMQHLKGMIDGFDNLPNHARIASVTHMDFHYALLTIYELMRLK